MPARLYYLLTDGARHGPLGRDELMAFGLRWDTLVWYKGCRDWLSARDVEELVELFDEPPPAPESVPSKVPTIVAAEPVDSSAYTAEARGRAPARPPADVRIVQPTKPQRLRFDDVSIRKLHRVGQSLYVTGLLLLILCGLLAYAAVMLDFMNLTPRFDARVRQILIERNQGVALAEIVAIVASVAAGVFGLPLLVAGIVFVLILLHRSWAVIQDGRARARPGPAVGLLFVPFFNFYWVFVAVRGLAVDLKRFAARYELNVPRPAPLLGIVVGVYFVLALIPYLGVAGFVLLLIVLPFFVASIARTTAALCEEKNRAWVEETPPASEEQVNYEVRRRSPAIAVVTLTFIAVGLAPIALALFVVGALGSGAMAVEQVNVQHRVAANAHAFADAQAIVAVPANRNQVLQRQNQLRQAFDQARLAAARRSEDLFMFLIVTAGGFVLLLVTGALLLVARTLNRRGETEVEETFPDDAPAERHEHVIADRAAATARSPENSVS